MKESKNLILRIFFSKCGKIFREVAMSKSLSAAYESFESSIIELKNEDFRTFIEELKLSH